MNTHSLAIPELSLVCLIGVSGSGKSTFARKHFATTEIVSSDQCRGIVSDDENDQTATGDAFELLHAIAGIRLRRGLLTVVDATSVDSKDRAQLVKLARTYHAVPCAVVIDVDVKVCAERNATRPDRNFGAHVIPRQAQQLRRGLRNLKREGFRYIYHLNTAEAIDGAVFERTKLWPDKRDITGPFDIIGDIHGCYDELVALLASLGYTVAGHQATAPEGRTAIFLGDFVDRGPRNVDVLRLVMNMVRDGAALAVPGNHDVKLVKALRGHKVRLAHGLGETMEQLNGESDEFRGEVRKFIDGLVSHLVLAEGRLVVAHGGMKESMQGRASSQVRDFALYGESTGEIDTFGLPVRYNWAAEYRGRAKIVYGHTPIPTPEWTNSTLNIDTGCVFGGALTALRYPEMELVSVPAARVYCEPVRPIAATTGPVRDANVLDIRDVSGKRIIETRLRNNVTIDAVNNAAALEVMSRFAADPRRLIYLPPTMAPCESSDRDGFLEHPAEAFVYFRSKGVARVVCQEKHMGSRAVALVCRDEETATRRFAIESACGAVVSRTGRPFFNDAAIEAELMRHVAHAIARAGLWDEWGSDWVCLDTELMPWSFKAQGLLRDQYALTGAASTHALGRAADVLARVAARNVEASAEATALAERTGMRADAANAFRDAYRRYCWNATGLADLKLAPFAVLAYEKQASYGRDNGWHIEQARRITAAQEGPDVLIATRCADVDLNDDASVAAATNWWLELTEAGGEGMVVKPFEPVTMAGDGLVQPGVKCRGREYLRIIYGPEYTAPENLVQLRKRHLRRKQSLALREFALGVEALDRYVGGEPLHRVHECVFAVLALESEAVDPRL